VTSGSHDSDSGSWLTGVALAHGGLIMRGAIWSMHCIAMRAVDFPTRVSAHLIETIASICSAIIAARRRPLSHQHTSLKNWCVCVGGVCMGPGSAAMHDLGMRAVRGCGLAHALRLVAACVVGASIAALCFAFYKRGVFVAGCYRAWVGDRLHARYGDGRHLLRGAGRQRRAECADGYAELLADLSACGNLSLLALLSTQYRLA